MTPAPRRALNRPPARGRQVSVSVVLTSQGREGQEGPGVDARRIEKADQRKLPLDRTGCATCCLSGSNRKPRWHFPHQEGHHLAGITAFDRSGQGNNGTLTNGPTKAIGRIGQALSFDGTGQRVDAGSASSLDNLGPLTASAWMFVKHDETGTIHRVVAKDNSSANGSWNMSTNSSGVNRAVTFRIESQTPDTRTTADNIYSLNGWYHVVVTWG
jgi:hypothetical protein